MLDDSMLRTANGNEIKVKEKKDLCIVYFQNSPESVAGPDGVQRMEQEIPNVAFVGAELGVDYPAGQIVLVPLSHSRLQISYRIQGEARERSLNIQCNSRSDQFPARVRHFQDVREYLGFIRDRHSFRYVVAYEGIGRVGLVKIKAGNPEARILVVKQIVKKAEKSDLKADKVRATDLGMEHEAARNPVFLARLYLRNLELDKVANLLAEHDMSADETGFIMTFLKIMIKNEQGRDELEQIKNPLHILEKLYEISSLILSGDREGFAGAIQSGMPQAVFKRVLSLVTQKRNSASSKLEEIYYWEWQYRLKKSASNPAA